MIIAVLLFLAFIVLLLAMNFRSRYTWGFILAVLSIDILMLALMLFRSKFPVGNAMITGWDSGIYLWASRRKIGFYEIVNLFNIGIFLYMIAMSSFISYFLPKHKKSLKVILILIPAIAFLSMNSSQMGRSLHCWINMVKGTKWQGMVYALWETARIVHYLIVVFYIITPIAMTLLEYKKTRILYNKRLMIVIGSTLAVLNIFFAYVLYLSSFGFALIDLKNLLKFNNMTVSYSQTFYMIIPFIVLVFVNFSIILFVRYHVLERIDFLSSLTISKRTKLLFEDIRPVMHSYKNVLLGIEFLGKDIIDGYGSEQALEDAKELVFTAQNASFRLSELLNIFNDSHVDIELVNLGECINTAIKSLMIRQKIKVNFDEDGDESIIMADKRCIELVFENLFYNSYEALEEKETEEEKKIDISIERERDWYCVFVRDNGLGIEKKNLKKIFKPLFSTKRTSKNWGIGLSYVYKAIQIVRKHIKK